MHIFLRQHGEKLNEKSLIHIYEWNVCFTFLRNLKNNYNNIFGTIYLENNIFREKYLEKNNNISSNEVYKIYKKLRII